MKKLFLLALSVSLLGSMSMQADALKGATTKANANTISGVAASRTHGVAPHAVSVLNDGRARVTPNADGALVWDFEDASQFAEFTLVDNDGDGYNWQYYNNEGLTTGQMTTHGGMGIISSASYINDEATGGGMPVTPDNWLISPVVDLGGTLTFWAMGQDASWCDEVFGVYVCIGESTSPADFVQIGTDKTATDEYVLYDFDLSQYAGQTGRFAIVHHNVTDMFMLNIDDITLNASAVVIPEPTLPTELTVEPAATYADVAWVPGENNDTWNLRYREVSEGEVFFEGFDGDAIPEGWTTIDADGDGNNWYVFGWAIGATSNVDGQGNPTFFGDGCATSASYLGAALTPDNWLISPKVDLNGQLSVMLRGQDPSWEAEHFAIYLSTTGTAVEDFTTVLVPETVAGKVYTEYTADLSAYAGQQGYIAIRHFNITDMFRLNVDNFQIGAENPWIEVEDVANPFTIDELTPETTYEVQVKAFGPADVETFNAAGGKATEWTESAVFTTLAEDPLVGVETVKVETTGDNSYYNLMGQKVTGNLPAGIYIHNGKKILVK